MERARASPAHYAAVIAQFLEARKEGLSLPVTGDGLQTRDFIHVDDVVRANMLAATSASVGSGETVNIASGAAISILQLANMFGCEVSLLPKRTEIRHSVADISRATALLGFKPEVFLTTGIKRLLSL